MKETCDCWSFKHVFGRITNILSLNEFRHDNRGRQRSWPDAYNSTRKRQRTVSLNWFADKQCMYISTVIYPSRLNYVRNNRHDTIRDFAISEYWVSIVIPTIISIWTRSNGWTYARMIHLKVNITILNDEQIIEKCYRAYKY